MTNKRKKRKIEKGEEEEWEKKKGIEWRNEDKKKLVLMEKIETYKRDDEERKMMNEE